MIYIIFFNKIQADFKGFKIGKCRINVSGSINGIDSRPLGLNKYAYSFISCS